jgi:methylmalonyl-CoA/ethylmalonyl-CoA epimerase
VKVHHIGFVVSDIEGAYRLMKSCFGLTGLSEIFSNPSQKVRVAFASLENGYCVEFIEPAAEDSPVRQFLSRGGGLDHLCFECTDLDGLLPLCETRDLRWSVRPYLPFRFRDAGFRFSSLATCDSSS